MLFIVGYHYDGAPVFLVQSMQQLHHFRSHFGVQVTGRLIGEDYLRIADNGACDGNTLALTAGELCRHVAHTVAQAFPLGLLWGWLPCGLVYSALVTALTSGSAARGAGLMLAFGAGTLPNLLLAGLLAARLNEYATKPVVRLTAGLVVLAFGLWGLKQAIDLGLA